MSETQPVCFHQPFERFLSEDLSSQELADFEQHLSHCSECDQRLTEQTADTDFWKDTHAFLADETEMEAPLPIQSNINASLLSSFLGPTDDPHMLGRFAGYEIVGVVGRGGMGIVMKGYDRSLARYVAIKVLDPSQANMQASRERFAREAKAAAAVVDDNVIPIYGVDHWNNVPYLVMPYVKGESLQQRIDRAAPLPIETTLEVALQISRGLAAAHDQGLVHRDIKPSNILIPASVSRILITDFGLARSMDDHTLTQSGTIAGTPQYMSPEQIRGDTVDGRTDLFSLGSVIYAMACGHPPFQADYSYAIIRRITDERHRRLSQVRPGIPDFLDELVDRLLEKNPDRRFTSAQEVACHIERCLAHLRQPGIVSAPRFTKHPREMIAVWVALALLALVSIGILSWSLWPYDNQAAQAVIPQADLSWKYDDKVLDQLESEIELLREELGIDPKHSDQSP
jgi:eukaryotic-like serine/threonine-protein kinase